APYTQDVSADLVLGQSNFNTSTLDFGTDSTQLNKRVTAAPSGLAFDAAGRLYICDNLARVTVWVPPFSTGGQASRILGAVKFADDPISETKLGGTQGAGYPPPEGVFTIGNNAYVIDTPSSRIVRYDPFETWAAETKDN